MCSGEQQYWLLFIDQNGKDNSGRNGHQESFLTSPLINRTCSGQTVQGFVRHYFKKRHEERVENLWAACCTAWLSWWGVFSLYPVSCFILWLLSIVSPMLHSASSRRIIKAGFKLAIWRHITYLLSIPSTQFLVSLLIPFLHIPSVASLLSVHPWLLWVNYCVFTA